MKIAFKIGVIDEILIHLARFGDIDLKGREQLPACPALNLLYHISAVGQILGFGKACGIADQGGSLRRLGIVKRACRLEIDQEHRTFLRGLDLGAAVIGMLDDGDIALDDLLIYIGIDRVQLYGVVTCIGVQIVNRRIKQIPF